MVAAVSRPQRSARAVSVGVAKFWLAYALAYGVPEAARGFPETASYLRSSGRVDSV
jgi:hypothetical protein